MPRERVGDHQNSGTNSAGAGPSSSNLTRGTEENQANPDNHQISLLSLTGLIRLISLPFHFVYDTLFGIIRFAWSLIRPDPRINLVDPLGDVLRFIETFEHTYGTNHPVFYRGTYNQALSDAKKELKFLLVYLHSEHHRDTHDFCATVLTHSLVINYINRNKLLFWACSVESPEGYRVSLALRETAYPFLALITLKENRMTVVRTFPGPTSVERFLSNLQKGIEDNETALIAARIERQERNMNQILRQEQDEAYMESLKADQEKDRKKQEEKRKKEDEEKEKQQREMNEQMRREQLIKMKVDLVDRIPPEPESSDPNAIKILIKLPNGKRLERRFRKNDAIKSLYYFVFCHDQSPLRFQITTNFPRKELPGSPPSLEDPDCNGQVNGNAAEGSESPGRNNSLTLEQVGLGKSEVLFVHDLEA